MFNTITSIALILISIGVMVVYISPKYQEISSLRAQNEELSAAILKTKDIEETSRKLSDTMRSFSKDDLDRLEKLLPQKFDELRFVNSMQGVAARNSVSIQDISIDSKLTGLGVVPTSADGGALSEGGYAIHEFSITVSASYEVFLRFLKDLERSLQFIDITSISLSQGGGGLTGSAGTYAYKIDFKTYSLK